MAQEEGLHKHAFWLYGVIVGLAIKESLIGVLPQFFSKTARPYEHLLEGVRLFVFLILITRFYLGAVKYFDDAYACGEADSYKTKNYLIDFLIGFFHFLFFFALAISIDVHERPERLFPLLLIGILVYDLPWLLINWYNDTYHLIKLWAFVNLGTLVVGSFTYLGFRSLGYSRGTSEIAALCWVLIVSLVDIAEMISRQEIFARGLHQLTNRKPQNPSPS
jgi:hypothetical protein